MAATPDTAGKDLVELFDMLKPIPEPAPISLWPATAIWAWLGVALLALVAWLGWHAWRRWRANAYRRAALAELAAAGDDPGKVASILRRAALAGFPRREVAGLVGDDWLHFLDSRCPGAGFASDLGAMMLRAPYAPQPPAPALTGMARRWLRRHRAGRAA